MKVTVNYNSRMVRVICAQDGRWIVTTHVGKIVKAQKVDPSDEDERTEVITLGAGPTLFGSVARQISQADCLAKMLSHNTQWLVEVKGNTIRSAAVVSKPVVAENPEVEVPAEVIVDGVPDVAEPKSASRRKKEAQSV